MIKLILITFVLSFLNPKSSIGQINQCQQNIQIEFEKQSISDTAWSEQFILLTAGFNDTISIYDGVKLMFQDQIKTNESNSVAHVFHRLNFSSSDPIKIQSRSKCLELCLNIHYKYIIVEWDSLGWKIYHTNIVPVFE